MLIPPNKRHRLLKLLNLQHQGRKVPLTCQGAVFSKSQEFVSINKTVTQKSLILQELINGTLNFNSFYIWSKHSKEKKLR